jgi:hypothetical protein
MNILGSLIKPELAINMIRKQLETVHGKKVTSFDIFFSVDAENIIFIVEGENYEMSEKNLREIILKKGKEVIKKGSILKAILAHCENKKIEAKVFFDENNIQKFINYNF